MKLITILFLFISSLAYGQDSATHVYTQRLPIYRPGEVIPAKSVEQLVDAIIPPGKVYTLTEVDMTPVTIQAIQPVSQSGVTINSDYIGSTDAGDYVTYQVPLLGKTKVTVTYARQWDAPSTGQAEVRAGSLTGPLLATVMTPNTGGWGTYSTIQTALKPSNDSTVFIVFKTTGVGNIKEITFK